MHPYQKCCHQYTLTLSKLLFKLLILCKGVLSIIAFLFSCMKKRIGNCKSFSTFLKFVGYLGEK